MTTRQGEVLPKEIAVPQARPYYTIPKALSVLLA